MTRPGTPLIGFCCLLLLVTSAAYGQNTLDSRAAQALLDAKILSLAQEVRDLVQECGVSRPLSDPQCAWLQSTASYSIAQAVRDTPLTAPSATQQFGPGGSSGIDLVQGPSLAALFSLALENNVVEFGGGKTTASISPFLFATWRDPSILSLQSEYERYAALRRFNGTVTFGGSGDSFDRNGDGEPDAAPVGGPTDIVTFELPWRIFGSRDRRDPQNFRRYLNSASGQVGNAFQAFGMAFAAFVTQWGREIANMSPPPSGEVLEGAFRDFLDRDDVERSLMPVALLRERLLEAHRQADLEIDRSAVWTLTAGWTHQGKEFGPDRARLGVRGVWSFLLGTTPFDGTVNATYVHAQSLADLLPAGDNWAVGWKLSTKLLQRQALLEEGLDWSVNVSGEFFDSALAPKHDTIIKVGTTFRLNFSKSVSIPFSVNYANHRDLLTGADRVFGHVGLSYDFSALR